MKNRMITLALLSALSAIASAQASEFDGLYIGGRVGENRSDISGTNPVASKDTTTWGIDEGYNWDLQQFLLGVNFAVDVNGKADRVQSPNTPINYGSSAIGLGLKLGLPMGSWLPYAHLGFAKIKGSNAAYQTTYHFSGFDFRGGLGVEYKLATNWSANLEWANSALTDNGNKLKNDNLTVGLKYYFNEPVVAPAPAPAPAPIPAPAPVVVKEAPAPAPVVVPPPQPKESWKTILTENPVTLEGANFATDSAKLLKTADVKLNEVVNAAKQHSEVGFEVSGHTYSRGKKAHNQKLSESRAASVKAWLVKHGVAADRIKTVGYADTKPIGDNKTKAGRAANRRVEVHYVIKEEKKIRVTE